MRLTGRLKAAGKTPMCLKLANNQTSASSLIRSTSSMTVSWFLSKILLFRSFQIIQEVRMTRESKHFRSAFCNLLRDRVHQSARESSKLLGVRKCHLNRSKMLNQGSVWIHRDNDYLSPFSPKLFLMHPNIWDNFGLKWIIHYPIITSNGANFVWSSHLDMGMEERELTLAHGFKQSTLN